MILTAATRGGTNETYQVPTLSPLWATQHARTPTPGVVAPPTSSAEHRYGGPLQPTAMVLRQREQVGVGGDLDGLF
jgi:hypothetical protein